MRPTPLDGAQCIKRSPDQAAGVPITQISANEMENSAPASFNAKKRTHVYGELLSTSLRTSPWHWPKLLILGRVRVSFMIAYSRCGPILRNLG